MLRIVLSVFLPNGQTLTYTYNTLGRLVSMRDNAGNKISYTYDANGNLTETRYSDSAATVTRLFKQAFDLRNRLNKLIGANQQTQLIEYDGAGNVTAHTDALNYKSVQAFDGLNRRVRATDALSAVTRFTYDSHDRLTRVTDAKGLSTYYQYNTFGDLIKQASPDTGLSQFTYDSAGNMKTATDARGIVSTYQYDALNRLTGTSFPTVKENITYVYDDTTNNPYGVGRLTSINDETGVTRYYYDGNGQLIKQMQTTNGRDVTTGYRYDAAGLLTQTTYPGGRVVNYQRSSAGYITGVSTTIGGKKQVVANNITYQPFGSLKALTFGNGKVLKNSMDQDYRLTRSTVTGVLDLSYSYTDRNNISAIVDALAAKKNQTFSYDAVSRLKQASGVYGKRAYTYDNVANRLSKTENGVLQRYDYHSKNHQLKQVTQSAKVVKAFSYDAAGNTLTHGDLHFTYNQAGRLSKASKTGMKASYQYNALGQRIKKTVNGITAHFYYNRNGQLLAETDAKSVVQREYIYLDGMRLAMISNGQLYYLHVNHLNSPVAMTDQSGVIQWQGDYSPFGKVSVGVNTVEQKLRLPGQYFDEETRLYYNYYRDYDSQSGRYIQSDPIGLDGGLNSYAYVGGNPILYIDPLGLKVQICSQPAFGWAPVDHQWIKTDTREAGMGPVGGDGNAGNRSGDLPGDPVEVTDHSGRHKQKGASCEDVDNVDENKVNDLLKIGRKLGRWGPTNQCQSFARDVLNQSTIDGYTY